MGDEATTDEEMMADQLKKYKSMTSKVTKDAQEEIGKWDVGDSVGLRNRFRFVCPFCSFFYFILFQYLASMPHFLHRLFQIYAIK